MKTATAIRKFVLDLAIALPAGVALGCLMARWFL